MDGNGRWASARGLPRTEGHAAGETALLDVVNGALEIGIKWITLYAFSTENWRRPPDEVRYLMNFNQSLLMRRRDELNEKGVQIRFAGRRDWRVPRRVLKRMDESIELTKHNRRMVMTMAFNYGGRAEIVDAVRALVAEGIPADKVDEKAIRAPPLLPRHARPRPGHPDLGRDAHLELPAVGDRLQRAGLPRDPLARHAPRATSTRRSSTSSAGCAASAPSTPDPAPARRPPPTGLTGPRPAAAELREWGRHDRSPGSPSIVGIALLVLVRRRRPRGRRLRRRRRPSWSVVAIAVLVGAGNLLYGRHSHGAKAVDRVRPGPGGPRPGRRPWPPRPAGPWPRPPRRGERYCPLDPAHRTDAADHRHRHRRT